MTSPNPYTDAPAKRYWRLAVAEVPPSEVDPMEGFGFRIKPTDKVVTAGSCFSQHLSRRLKAGNYNFLVTETAHPLIPKDVALANYYGIFSARYGNIYSARQLLQLLRRAYGRFKPVDDAWEENGRWYDPFRPQIQPGGFASKAEYDLDRQQHFAAVRRAFEEMDVFIFTLGLTECWLSREDGACYTVCPGTAAGTFDPDKHVFKNFGPEEVAGDLRAFIAEVREVNPKVKVILTVSPVPLVATAEDQHILAASTYTKSVLRVAAGMVSKDEGVYYLPTYEIGVGNFSRGRYFAENLRLVTEAGLDHAMRLFFKHCTEGGAAGQPPPQEDEDTFLAESKAAVAALCDEEMLDREGALQAAAGVMCDEDVMDRA